MIIKDTFENKIERHIDPVVEIGGETEKDAETTPQIIGGIGLSIVIIFFFLLFKICYRRNQHAGTTARRIIDRFTSLWL